MVARSERTGRGEAAPRPLPGVIPPAWASAEPDGDGRAGKAARPVLSREAIVKAALRVVDAEGYDALSMRRVAQEFGTGAASLYAYVANRDELEDLLVDRVIGECPVPVPGDPDTWQERLKKWILDSYRILTAHRDVARALVGRIPFGPNSLANFDGTLGLLHEAGLPDFIIGYAPALLGQYLTGAAIDAYAWQLRHGGQGEGHNEEWVEQIVEYLSSLPQDRFPNVVKFARSMMGGGQSDPPYDRFELGLEIMIRGLASFREERKPGETDEAGASKA